MTGPEPGGMDPETDALVRRHVIFGWGALFVFLSFGLVLEALHAFKIGWYLDVANATRRQMWTLAHTHGTLFALANIAFAFSLRTFPSVAPRLRGLASPCLVAATVLMPVGFLLGGIWIYGGDPGLGVLLAPAGGALLALGALITFLALRGSRPRD
jgi:hypothetical protein